MDIGFEGGFWCLKKAINSAMHKEWITQDNGSWVKLAKTNFETVFANDINPYAKAAWVSYFEPFRANANEIYHLNSIVDLVKSYQQGQFSFPDNIDMVTGGFPCQDFSVAGKRRGFNSHKSHLGGLLDKDEPTEESRGKLYMWLREVISITQPKMFIAENVKGLTNLDNVKDIIEHDFASAANGGYLIVPSKVLYAPDYGVPQSRERVFFIGFKKSALTKEALYALSQESIDPKYDPYPLKTHSAKGDVNFNHLVPIVTCKDAFIDLKEPDCSDDPSQQKYSKAKFMGSHCQGQTEVKLHDVGPTIRSEHHGNIEYRRLSREHGGTNSQELLAGLPERRLTVRECARIQTFPNDYQFILGKTATNVAVSASNAYKIIGNAVPCVLAYHLAKNLEAKWPLYFKVQLSR